MNSYNKFICCFLLLAALTVCVPVIFANDTGIGAISSENIVSDSEDPEEPTDPEEPVEPEPNPWPASMVSGTLPVIYINTEDGAPIVSKEYYINATYWIDPMDTDFESVGSEENPQKAEIRGRGNYTWRNFDKKPYKLKLDERTALLGLPESKNWALMANAESMTYITTETGFDISRKMGLAWTPSQQPVEVVMNNEYIGLYWLCETIRVEETRVNIHEQKDEETDAEEVEGGWLVEIDNYLEEDKDQIVFYEHEGQLIIFTPNTPENLSDEQREYITRELHRLNDLIYAEDKSDSSELEAILDFEALARFYLVQELLDEDESFSGSCYFYKDKGEGKKWTFGPVWDMGNALNRKKEDKGIKHFFEDTNYTHHWMPELLKFPTLREYIMRVWDEFKNLYSYEAIVEGLENRFFEIENVYKEQNNERWPQYYLAYEWHKNWMFENLLTTYNLVDAWYRTLPEFYVYAPADSGVTTYDDGDEEPEEPEVKDEWVKIAKFIGQPDCKYTAQIDELPMRFKIASDDEGTTFVLGAPEGAESIVSGLPYNVEECSNDFTVDYPCEDVTLIYDPARKTILIQSSKTSGISTTLEDAVRPAYSLEGRAITAHEQLDLYNIAGQKIATLEPSNSADLPSGLYIVKSARSRDKIFLR